MPIFTVTGDLDPFLHVSLEAGESISCESGAMVMMEATLDLSGQMQGGFLSALTRRLVNGESFFQQHIKATRGKGDCLLAPTLPGSVQILDVGKTQYNIADGAYLAATAGVNITARMQNLGTAIFGGTGGFFIGQTSGEGQVAVNGLGSLFMLDVAPDHPVTIDNEHVVAWDSRLHYDISASTQESNRGMLGQLVNSVTSGEMVVLKFSGQGKVLLCSRNAAGLRAWATK